MYLFEALIAVTMATSTLHILHRLCQGDLYLALSGVCLTLTILKYACGGLQPLLQLGTFWTPFTLATDALVLCSFLHALYMRLSGKDREEPDPFMKQEHPLADNQSVMMLFSIGSFHTYNLVL